MEHYLNKIKTKLNLEQNQIQAFKYRVRRNILVKNIRNVKDKEIDA